MSKIGVAALVGLFFTVGSTVMYAPTETDPGTDPLIGFFYSVDAPGKLTGYFIECSGIGSANEVIEQLVFIEGAEVVIKVPGRLSWHNLVLKRGITSNTEAWAWRKMVEDGNITGARVNLTLTMLGPDLTAVAKWNFVNCWPSSLTFEGPDGLAIETLTLAYEYYERVQ
ncbi:MAG TPA: phage tail protein [Oceanipulchritudo sp.]|nr:phage tail protein [Oceanipulchritudo sp.]